MKKIALLCLLLATIALLIPHAYAIPLVESFAKYDGKYIRTDNFLTTDDVYVYGTGLLPNTQVNVSVVVDRTWTDGMKIGTYVKSHMVWTDGMGSFIGYENFGTFPTGYYDVVVDVHNDKYYNATWDALDNNDYSTAGFYVGLVGGITVPLDKLGILAPYIGLASIITVGAVVATITYRRRKK